MIEYDAIVVGARCAGAATAMLLARRGLDVLLVDRARFPSEIPHGHFVHRGGPQRLARWGLLDAVIDSGCPPITTFTQDLGDFPLTGRDIEPDGVAFGIAPRRAVLDNLLVLSAAEAGADVVEGFPVIDYTTDGGRVTGIRGRDGVRARARIVVGADGRNSLLARKVAARVTASAPTLTCWYFSYFSGFDVSGLEMYVRDRRVVFAFPTNDGLTGLFVGWPIDELPAVKRGVEQALAAAVTSIPGMADRFAGASREERLMGATQLPNFMRRPQGPGWALVGDAGCHKDPFLALGVCDAFRDAELLAEAIAQDRLPDYERRRDEATALDFRMNMAGAQLGPAPPETYAARAAVRGDERATQAHFLALQAIPAAPSPRAGSLAAR